MARNKGGGISGPKEKQKNPLPIPLDGRRKKYSEKSDVVIDDPSHYGRKEKRGCSGAL